MEPKKGLLVALFATLYFVTLRVSWDMLRTKLGLVFLFIARILLAKNAYSRLNRLKQFAIKVDSGLEKSLATLGDVCRWVKNQCSRKLVDWLYDKFRHQAKPKTIYQMLKI
jgi:hypothetical protein